MNETVPFIRPRSARQHAVACRAQGRKKNAPMTRHALISQFARVGRSDGQTQRPDLATKIEKFSTSIIRPSLTERGKNYLPACPMPRGPQRCYSKAVNLDKHNHMLHGIIRVAQHSVACAMPVSMTAAPPWRPSDPPWLLNEADCRRGERRTDRNEGRTSYGQP